METTYADSWSDMAQPCDGLRQLRSIYVFSYFPFGFEGRMWNLIVSVPDHCLSFYFVGHEVKVSMTYISRSSDFALYLGRLFDVCTSYFGSMNQYDPKFDLKINVGHCELYFMVQ